MRNSFLFFAGILLPMSFCSQSKVDDHWEIQKLVSLSKLYGYVRYFYPGDEAAKIDYPKFIEYAVPLVQSATNKLQLKSILDSLFLPIAPGIILFDDSTPAKFNQGLLTPKDTTNMKQVSWQHLGFGLSQNALYREIRTNRIDKNSETNGNITTYIDAKPYRGKKIRLKACVKIEANSKTGNGHLWIRVDRPNAKVGFVAYMVDNPIISNEWRDYEIEGVVDEDAIDISFGAFLLGSGKLWVDDIQFAVQDTEMGWTKLDGLDGDFENTTVGHRPSYWECQNKFYQASVTGETACSGKHSICISRLESLFGPRAHVGDFINKSLTSGLSVIIPLALYGDEKHTYPLPDQVKYFVELGKINESISDKFDMENPAARLGVAISFWNMFQHFYPYFNEVKVDWEGKLPDLLSETIACKNSVEFLHLLQKYQAFLNDGHGHITIIGQQLVIMPFVWEWVENKLVITNVFDKDIGINKGDIVLSIDHVIATKYIDSCMRYTSAATDAYRVRKTLNSLLYGELGSSMKLTVMGSSSIKRELTIKRGNPSEESLARNYSANKDSIKSLGKGILYVNIHNTSDMEMNARMSDLARARCVIFDFRGYIKSRPDFIQHLLTQKDTDTSWFQVPQIIYPDHLDFSYHYSGWNLLPSEPHIKAKIIVIVDSRAISAAESFLSYFEKYKLGIIIGQPSAGTNGNINSVNFSGIYNVIWTGMHVVKHDGSQHHGVGIIPNVLIERTVKGIREGRDEFLEKAIELAHN